MVLFNFIIIILANEKSNYPTLIMEDVLNFNVHFIQIYNTSILINTNNTP
jgi:hypothetical protein